VLATIIEVQCRQAERARILGLPEIHEMGPKLLAVLGERKTGV
jgi:hypothetical protein